MKNLITVLTAFAAASLASAARADETRLAAASIHDLFPGYYQPEVLGGYTLLIAAKANGRLDGKAFGGEDKGKWRIVGNRLCVLWVHWTNGEAKCGQIVQAGGWYVAWNQEEGELLRFRAIGADTFIRELASASDIDRN